MSLLFFIGLFCFLWIIGSLFTDDAVVFAFRSMVWIVGLIFLFVVLTVLGSFH